MTYVNVPPNLRDLFQGISDRITKLELSPSGAQDSADAANTAATAAQSTANTANSTANSALTAATQAYNTAVTAVQKDSYNIFNASNQLTAINGNGITVYAGSSPTSGARVVLNSAGLAGVDSGGNTTFSINAATGSVSMTGTITSTSGTIGGFVISSGYLYNTIGGITLNSNGTITTSGTTYTKYLVVNSATLGSNYMAVGGDSVINGNLSVANYFYDPGHATTTSTANAYLNSISGLLARSTSSQRYKVEIEPQDIPLESFMALQPKSYIDKAQYEENNNSSNGLQRLLGLIAEDVAQIPVIGEMLANKNKDGNPDSVNYDRVAVALIPIIKSILDRLNKLETK